MKKTNFYLIFHCNLSFSSIEEEQLKDVIHKCYFPLIETISQTNTKTGIELSGFTLEKLSLLEPKFLKELKKLLSLNLIEIIGSGYQQIIGPIVPYSVNLKNQQIGFKVYKKLLDLQPKIAFLNEQVFSKSMVDLYKKFYHAICMEWNNPYSINAHRFEESFGFSPIIAQGIKSTMPLVWTNSILFQQFQRTAHSQNTLDDYLVTIERYIRKGYKCLPIYSSDLEIFNFRPGRFHTENDIIDNEWQTISEIFTKLKELGNFVLPSQTLQFLQNKVIDITTPSVPIVVKKQTKYSLSRWSVSGLGGHYINTLCYNYLQTIKNKNSLATWKKLLQYYGSDYRTHTTVKKWKSAILFLESNKKDYSFSPFDVINKSPIESTFKDSEKKIVLENKTYRISFLKNKGLCLESAYKLGKRLAFGSVNHGELDYITHGADYYTGTTTIESSQLGRIANLSEARNIIIQKIDKDKYILKGEVYLSTIAIEKRYWFVDFVEKKITLFDFLELKEPIKASIRMGTFTLLPIIKTKNFWYACKNGGLLKEKFFIQKDTQILQHLPISVLQSSNGGVGITDGNLEFGIGKSKILKLHINQSFGWPLVLMQNSIDSDKYLTRVFFSVQELDDTLKPTINQFQLSYTIYL